MKHFVRLGLSEHKNNNRKLNYGALVLSGRGVGGAGETKLESGKKRKGNESKAIQLFFPLGTS
jgi:hypothetical protein